MTAPLVPILLAFLLGWSFACAESKSQSAAPGSPEMDGREAQGDDAEASSRSLSTTRTDGLIEFYRGRTRRDPGDYRHFTKLAEAYVQKARETGDTEYFEAAADALSDALARNPESYSTLLYMGQVSSARHEFGEALRYAERAAELASERGPAYGVMGDAYMELGRYRSARAAYEKMVRIQPDLYSYSRRAHIRELTGDVEGAMEDMRASIDAGARQNLPKENLAWAHVILGSLYFNDGRLQQAEQEYERAAEILPHYYLALEHLAEIHAARGEYERAVEDYQKVLRTNPDPEFHIALGEVYQQMGNQRDAHRQFRRAQHAFDAYRKDGNEAHLGDMAIFYAEKRGELDEALRLAKRDLARRDAVDAHDTMAWVFYHRGEYEDAVKASDKALRLGTRDASFHYHAGMIHHALGRADGARRHLGLALSINPYFDTQAAKEARAILQRIGGASRR